MRYTRFLEPLFFFFKKRQMVNAKLASRKILNDARLLPIECVRNIFKMQDQSLYRVRI